MLDPGRVIREGRELPRPGLREAQSTDGRQALSENDLGCIVGHQKAAPSGSTTSVPSCGDSSLAFCLRSVVANDLARRGNRSLANARPRRSEERRVGQSVSVRVDLGGRRLLKKNK